MINPLELRIGNWVMYSPARHDNMGKITTVYNDHAIADYEWEAEKAIALTPEILLKCGFEKKADGYQKPLANQVPETGNHLIYDLEQAILSLGSFNKSSIRYLHQLQNFLFYLSGEELDISF